MDVRFTGDVASFKFAEYSRALSSTNINLKGNDSAIVAWILFPDTLISQSNRTTVDAYLTLDDSLKFYDRAKSNICTNFAGQISTFVARSGNSIDAGNYNVNIDANAGVAFAISGNTITIKTNAFVGDMTTTGIISLLNGSTFSGTRTDANGTIAPISTIEISSIISLAGAEIRIYDNNGAGISMGDNLSGVESNPSSTYSYQHAGVTNEIVIQIMLDGYNEEVIPFTLTSGNQSLSAILTIDSNS